MSYIIDTQFPLEIENDNKINNVEIVEDPDKIEDDKIIDDVVETSTANSTIIDADDNCSYLKLMPTHVVRDLKIKQDKLVLPLDETNQASLKIIIKAFSACIKKRERAKFSAAKQRKNKKAIVHPKNGIPISSPISSPIQRDQSQFSTKIEKNEKNGKIRVEKQKN